MAAEALGITKQIGIVFFESGDQVFSVSIKQTKHGRSQVDRIGTEHVEASRVIFEHTGEQAQRGRDFVLSRKYQLTVHQEPQLSAHQLEGNQTVVILDTLFSTNLKPPLETLLTAAIVAAADLMTVDDSQLQSSRRLEGLVPLEFAVNEKSSSRKSWRLSRSAT